MLKNNLFLSLAPQKNRGRILVLAFLFAVGVLASFGQPRYVTIRLIQDEKPLCGYADFVGSDSVRILLGESAYTLSLNDDILMLKYQLSKDEKQQYGILSPDSLSIYYLKSDIPCIGQIKEKNKYITTIVNNKDIYVCSTSAIEKVVTVRNASTSELKWLNNEMASVSAYNSKHETARLAAERKALLRSGTLTKEQVQKLVGPSAWDNVPRYRGFVTINYSLGSGYGDYTADRLSVLTSHGAYLKNGMFIGGGIGFMDWFKYGSKIKDNLDYSIPVFLHLRTDFNKMTQSGNAPFVEARVGYAFGETMGWIISPSLGWHFYFGRSNVGLSLNVGYEMFRKYSSRSGYSAVQGGISFDF